MSDATTTPTSTATRRHSDAAGARDVGAAGFTGAADVAAAAYCTDDLRFARTRLGLG